VFSSAKEDRQARTLAAARQRLVRDCMGARGYSLTPPAPAPSIPIADSPPSADGYGLFAQFARFAKPPRRTPPREAGFRRALMGSPQQTGTLHTPGGMTVTYRSSGCYAHAMGTLYGSVRRYQRLVARRNELRIAADVRVTRDLRLAGALTGWTRCMKLRGSPYPSPDAARLGVYDAYMSAADRARVRRRELATAAADRYCAERTEIYAALARAQHGALRGLSSGQRAAATAIAGRQATALERARRVVTAAD
jgi:hypothetical protein